MFVEMNVEEMYAAIEIVASQFTETTPKWNKMPVQSGYQAGNILLLAKD